MKQLVELFECQIFNCSKCRELDNKNQFINPYLEQNRKIPDRSPNFYKNRRRFLIDHIKEKQVINIMIVGEAPGLNGCGYCGIGFTDEENAINRLGLPDYHSTGNNYQTEKSAEFIYDVLEKVAKHKDKSVKEISRQIFMTNSCMCVPIKENGKSILAPNVSMVNNCNEYLSKQIEIANPKVIILLGNKAINNVNKILRFTKGKAKVSKLVKENKVFNINNMFIVPEIHPSPLAKIGRHTRELYPGIKDRLFKNIANYLD